MMMNIYGNKKIKTCLTSILSESDLVILCYDYFPSVYQTFTAKTTLAERQSSLINHCVNNRQLPTLFNLLKKHNPTVYAHHQNTLQDIIFKNQPKLATSTNNPFQYSTAVSSDQFIGRWSLVEQIGNEVMRGTGSSYACIGGLRFGKTSLLYALQDYLQQSHGEVDHVTIPLLMSFKYTQFSSEQAFFAELLQQLYHKIDQDSTPPSKYPKTKIKLDKIRTRKSATELSNKDFVDTLAYIFAELYDEGGATRLVILLDEFDKALQYNWHPELLNHLRSLIGSSEVKDYVRFVIAGSTKSQKLKINSSPFFQELTKIYLTTFDQATVNQLCERAEGISDKVKDTVWWLSGGNPFFTQYLLYRANEQGIQQATPNTIINLASRLLHEEHYHFESLAQTIGADALRIYGLISQHNDWIDENEIIKQIKDLDIKACLSDLYYHGFITHEGNWKKYCRVGNLLVMWYKQEGQRMIELLSTPNKVV